MLSVSKVLILGAYGRLGIVLSEKLSERYQVIRVGRGDYAAYTWTDYSYGGLKKLLLQVDADVVINLIANTDVAACESIVGSAFEANTLLPMNLRAAIEESSLGSIHLIQISTDHLYDAPGLNPENKPNPKNVYGMSKLCGEIAVQSYVHSLVLRVNYFGLSHVPSRASLLDWLYGELKKDSDVPVFTNVYFSPLGCNFLCDAIVLAVSSRLVGVYNLGGQDLISKAQFAEMVADEIGGGSSLRPVEYKSSIPRPFNMGMDSSRLFRKLDLNYPAITEQIRLELVGV